MIAKDESAEGQFIEVVFKEPLLIEKLEYIPIAGPDNYEVKSLTVTNEYKDAEKLKINDEDVGTEQEWSLNDAPFWTNLVRITIDKVHGVNDMGASGHKFKLFGKKCEIIQDD